MVNCKEGHEQEKQYYGLLYSELLLVGNSFINIRGRAARYLLYLTGDTAG